MSKVKHGVASSQTVPETVGKVCLLATSNIPAIGRIVAGTAAASIRRGRRWQRCNVVARGNETVYDLMFGEKLRIFGQAGSRIKPDKFVFAKAKQATRGCFVN